MHSAQWSHRFGTQISHLEALAHLYLRVCLTNLNYRFPVPAVYELCDTQINCPELLGYTNLAHDGG